MIKSEIPYWKSEGSNWGTEEKKNEVLQLFCQGCGKPIANASGFLEYHGFKACSESCLKKIKTLPLWENVFDITPIDGKTLQNMLKRGLKRKGYQITKVNILNVAHYQMKANVLFSIELVEGADNIPMVKVDDFTYAIGKGKIKTSYLLDHKVWENKGGSPRKETYTSTTKDLPKRKRGRPKSEAPKVKQKPVENPTIFRMKAELTGYEVGETRKQVEQMLHQYEGQPVNNIQFTEIANGVGVSRQRVHQIFKKLIAY